MGRSRHWVFRGKYFVRINKEPYTGELYVDILVSELIMIDSDYYRFTIDMDIVNLANANKLSAWESITIQKKYNEVIVGGCISINDQCFIHTYEVTPIIDAVLDIAQYLLKNAEEVIVIREEEEVE